MMVKPTEAVKKTCPLIEGGQCVGAECMAWRWYFDRRTSCDFERGKLEKEGWRAVGVQGGTIPTLTYVRETGVGYCGLAGVPGELVK